MVTFCAKSGSRLLSRLVQHVRADIAPAHGTPRFRRNTTAILAALMLFLSRTAIGQANPTPNTFSTYAGGYGSTYTVGGTCGGSTSGSKYTAIDTLGNGCPFTQAIIGPSISGLGVDAAGNVYVEDYSNGQVRKIDAKSGIVTHLTATANTLCSSTAGASGQIQDSIGSGCVINSARGPSTARGMNVDSWGNVILGSYNSNMINVICLATSPLCPGTSGRKQVGYMYRVAGCIQSQGGGATAGSGTTGPTVSGTTVTYLGGDNSLASPFQNLAGDVAAWGLTGTAATNATVGTTGACGTTTGGVNSARNAQADKYGNVYIADTNGERYRVVLGPASYNGTTNPLFAIINMDPNYTAHEGYIYTILGSFSAYVSGGTAYNVPGTSGACSTQSGSGTQSDTYGDGCPFYMTPKPSGATSPAGLGVDKDGNPIFSDNQDSLVRVLYVGGTTMANIISKNNSGITPVVGNVYAIEGTGTATKGATPELDVSASSISSGNTKVAVDGQGNIYTSDGSGINIIDAVTGYLRRPISTGGTACSVFGVTSSIGDGCPTGQGASWSSLSSVGTAIAVDNLGNLLLADSTGRVRKILAGSIYPTPVGSTFTQNIVLHEPAGTTGITASLINAGPGFSIPGTAPACTLYTTSSDNTADCTIVVTFTPTVPGKVGAVLSVTNTGGGGATTLYQLEGTATGDALVTDTGSPIVTAFDTFTAGATPTSLALDTAGNFYTVDTHSNTVYQISPSGTQTTVGTAPAGVNQVAVDAAGNVYTTSVGGAGVSKFTLTGTGTWSSASTITNSAVAKPQGIVFDAQNNMYLSDATTASVYQIPNAAGYATLQAPTAIVSTGLTNPTLLALDVSGNLLIADTGIVYRFNASTGALTTVASSSAGGVILSGLTPVGLTTDAGNNVYIQDSSSKSVFEIPYQAFTPGYVTVLTGETTPSGVAVSATGQLYVADSGTAAINSVNRTSPTTAFGTNNGTAYGVSGTFTDVGNAPITGYADTNADFVFDTSSIGATTCGSIPATSGGTPSSTTLYPGGACTYNLYYNQGTTGNAQTGILTPLGTGNVTGIGTYTATGTDRSGTTWPTSTTVTQVGSGAVYAASGTEATFTVTVTNTSSTNTDVPSGSVTVSLTGCTGGSGTYPLTSGSATVNVSGCGAGTPHIAASYAGAVDTQTANSGFGASTSTTVPFTIAQASTSVSWTPGATTLQYSAAVGSSVLNASGSVAGVLVYTATPSGGSAQNITSSSFLAIGTYSLGVTLYPTDSVDYQQSTASVGTFTVTQATTNAPIGLTQMLVASDGTGNYTTVQSAVNAVGVSGGSIYIKPGTYAGFITVTQPNVALRGLGGDPTQVILTHEAGAFGSTYPYTGEFQQTGINAGNGGSNGYQLPSGSTISTGDQGSATLAVLKGVNTTFGSSTTIPNGFYSENLSIINGYDTDTSTTTTTYETSANGTCAINQSPAQTYSYLFNAQLLCGSQALAVSIQADQAVFNNVYATSLQDTIYSYSQSNGSVPSREYWFRGKVTGNVDYIFGDGADVFDYTTIYSAWHGNSATGTDTIHAQQKLVQTGSTSDYLSGFIMNSNIFTSQSTGMTALYFGRPYGTFSTWVMLNSRVDQVNPTGYTTGLGPSLADTTFLEYNDIPYTDPATNAADLNGILYLGTGGNTGTGVSGPRETSSTNPGTPESGNSTPTSMTLAQAQAYFPDNWFGQTIGSTVGWNATNALATNVNAFIPSGTSASIASGSSLTILMRPQTPGLGAVTNGTWTIPTGKYTLSDSYNGGASYVIATGKLDASGEAYFTTSTLSVGTHSLTWTYNGDTNFAGSTTSTAYTLTITGTSATTTTALSTPSSPIVYGQSTTVTATVTPTSGTATGNVTLFVDGVSYQTQALSSGQASFTVSGLSGGTHYFTASYAGATGYSTSSTTANDSIVVSQYPLTVTGSCSNRVYDQANSCTATVTSGTYQYTDNAASVFTTLTGTTTASRTAIAGSYVATPSYSLTTAGALDYSITPANSNFNITGGAPQSIIFPSLPNFPHGASYQLTARSTSGQAITYSVTAGSATVSGSTLTVNAAGLVTVQASSVTDPTGDYAAATPVSQSFTAP